MTISRSNRAWTTQCRVKGVGDVCSGDDDDVLPLVEAVHEGEELGDDSLFHISDNIFPPGGDGVDFVNEKDTRSLPGGFFKYFP